MTNLFISYYKATTPERQAEIDYCLKANCENPLIDRVCVLWYDSSGVQPMFNHEKIILIGHNTKLPDYKFFFDGANGRILIGNEISIIANADIIFDETLSHLDKLKENDCWALSRWEMKSDYTKHIPQIQIYGDSQDVWIFRGKIKPIGKADFPLGKMGCDNRIAYEIAKAGYNISNPSKTVHTWHLHNSGVRGYNPQVRNEHTVVPEPYLTVPVTAL